MFYKIKYNTVLARKSLVHVKIPLESKKQSKTQKQSISATVTTINAEKKYSS